MRRVGTVDWQLAGDSQPLHYDDERLELRVAQLRPGVWVGEWRHKVLAGRRGHAPFPSREVARAYLEYMAVLIAHDESERRRGADPLAQALASAP